MRKINILCDGGLGNRIACLLGGLVTADRLGLTPVIHWPSTIWCGAYFYDIFSDLGFEVTDLGVNDLMRNDSNMIFLIHENQTNAKLKTQMSHGMAAESAIRDMSDDVVFYSARVPSHLPSGDVLKKLHVLHTADVLQAQIDEFCELNNIDKTTVGLHLRKTDQVNLNEDFWFDYVQHKGAGKRYFICSDEQETEERFCALPNIVAFPKTHYVEKLVDGPWRVNALTDPDGRVFPNNVNRGRESVLQAWIDLQILSRTTILPTVKSSFSTLATWIGQTS